MEYASGWEDRYIARMSHTRRFPGEGDSARFDGGVMAWRIWHGMLLFLAPLAVLLMAGPASAQEPFVRAGMISGSGEARYSQYGTFVLTEDSTGTLYELRSDSVDLSLYTGRTVTVYGTLNYGLGSVQYGGLPLVEVTRIEDPSGSISSCGNCGVNIGQEARTTLEEAPEEPGGREVYDRALKAARSAGNGNAAIASEEDAGDTSEVRDVSAEQDTDRTESDVKSETTQEKEPTTASTEPPTVAAMDEQAAEITARPMGGPVIFALGAGGLLIAGVFVIRGLFRG